MSHSAAKRHRQNRKRRDRNRAVKSELKTRLRHVREAVSSSKVEIAEKSFPETAAKLDRAAARGIIHRNKAARLKSRLQQALRKIKTSAGDARQPDSDCENSPNPLRYMRRRVNEAGTLGDASSRIVAHVSPDSNDMEASNLQRRLGADGNVTIAVWPSDLTLSIELALRCDSVENLLQTVRRLAGHAAFRNSVNYLLVPSEDSGRSLPPSDVEAHEPPERLCDGLRRVEATPDNLARHFAAKVAVPGIFVLEADPGDVRVYHRSDDQFGVHASLWLSEALVGVVDRIIAVLHDDGRNASLRKICRKSVRELTRHAVEILKNCEDAA